LGTTLVIVAGEIDISVGSTFAIASVVAGSAATHGMPAALAAAVACGVAACIGLLNGALVAFAGIPSIVVTLATMIGLRDGLRWTTQGAWVENVPAGFQWLGLTERSYPIAASAAAIALALATACALRYSIAGRCVYAVGSHADAARLVGIDPARVKC